jgi:hypothetical protein
MPLIGLSLPLHQLSIESGKQAARQQNQQALERASAVVATRCCCRKADLSALKQPSATIGEIKMGAALARQLMLCLAEARHASSVACAARRSLATSSSGGIVAPVFTRLARTPMLISLPNLPR